MSNSSDQSLVFEERDLIWESLNVGAFSNDEYHRPRPSSGHSLTLVGDNAYLFGGLAGFNKSDLALRYDEDLKPLPSNVLYKLNVKSDANTIWKRLDPSSSECPLPRWKHTATDIDGTKLLIFGGFHSIDHRLNDVWIYDTVLNIWFQPNANHNYEASVKNQLTFTAWMNAPTPRAGHSATLIRNNLYIFGGYGGLGYSRRDLDDLYALNINTMHWTKLAAKGSAPEKRFGHQACAVGDQLIVFGGTSSCNQFQDVYILDLAAEPTWTKLNSTMNFPSWNHCAVIVPSVPNWKIFAFGGCLGNSNESNKISSSTNIVSIMNCGSYHWSYPNCVGSPPSSRCDSSIVYDETKCRLFVYGGWSEYWHNDMYILQAAPIIGPPYAITSMQPNYGPITGKISVKIFGVEFPQTSSINVQFRDTDSDNVIEVPGQYESSSMITCICPKFTNFRGSSALIRQSFDQMPFTTHSLRFGIFTVTDASYCVPFGPGLLNGCVVEEPAHFIIQARDSSGNDRTTGGDEFIVTVRLSSSSSPRESDLSDNVSVEDFGDGRYGVTYSVKVASRYKVSVSFAGTFEGREGPLRGSEYEVTFMNIRQGQKDVNHMLGELMIRSVKNDVNYLSSFVNEISKNMFIRIKDDSWTAEEHIKVLMTVKETILRAESNASNIVWLIDKSDCSLRYFKERDLHLPGCQEDLTIAKQGWEKISREGSGILTKVSNMMRSHLGKIRNDIESYESHVKGYCENVKKSDFYLFTTGPVCAIDNLDIAESSHQHQISICKRMKHVAEIFDIPENMTKSSNVISEVSDILKNFRLLWETYVHVLVVIEESNILSFVDLDPDAIDDSCKSLVASLRRLPKIVKSSDAFQGLEKIVKEFVLTCPLIVSLKSPKMRERHWKDLMSVVNRQFEMPSSKSIIKFKDFLKLKLHEHVVEVEEISEKANKEGKHEEILNNLEVTWSAAMFSMNNYQETNIPLLRLDDDVIEQLENDQMAVQSILSSRFQYFRNSALEWQQVLVSISDVTQLLSDIQRTWTYLEPLYMHSEEVMKELPVDTLKFQDVDKHVKLILKKAWKTKIVRTMCTQQGLLEALTDLTKRQDSCKKSLSEFIDRKRKKFPRFFFISEVDLLDILSNSSQPQRVLRHVDKFMLATKDIALSTNADKPMDATIFRSNVGNESIDFDSPVSLSGKAEEYLDRLLVAQMRTLTIHLSNSIGKYPMMHRCDWLLTKRSSDSDANADPAQISLLVSLIYFTKETEDALNMGLKNDQIDLRRYHQLCIAQLAELIGLTRSSLSKDDRQRVMCLITMDAHNRDTLDCLIRDKVTSSSDFQWQSKLRAYFNVQTVQTLPKNPTGFASTAILRICDASFDYGFEYLGNGPRLVITPLTDRIYVTAAQALHLKMGCAPSGPAGTGKTETTKDLASSLGKCCYVFNCSPEMDYQTMGNIFKGLAASGSWGCFDEFNRLIPEVLSVCSVQFKSICDGLRNYESSQYVIIEGDSISIDASVGVHITMNPGYLGRSELPEGLKALFRPITVMVPDLVLICENMLMAEGFQTAKTLAIKFYALYSLLSELLSRQSHYDWGLRAVKSVLVVAGQFRRSTQNLNEDDILFRALRDFNIPKIVQSDEIVFYGLLNDLFPDLNPPRVVDEELADCIVSACEDTGLIPDSLFTLKVTQLEELLDIRHCVFIMGDPGSGKTSCWKTLRTAKNIRAPMKKVKVVDINPKVLPTEDLYGHINLSTREWKDGLLSCVMRDLGNIPNDNPKWIVLDGDLDPNWIESMNSVMDDNKMLTLACNERIPLKSHMKMIFEISDLKYATPATVSRAGILFLSTESGTQWKCIVNRWMRVHQGVIHSSYSTSDDNSESTSFKPIVAMGSLMNMNDDVVTKYILKLQNLFDKYLNDSLEFFKTNLKGAVHVNDVSLTTWFLRLFDAMIMHHFVMNESNYDKILRLEDYGLEAVFVFTLIWGLGAVLNVSDDGTDYPKLFSDWFRTKYKTIKIPLRETVFDYYLDMTTWKFESWKSCSLFQTIEYNSNTMKMADILVPTTLTTSLRYWINHLIDDGYQIMLAGGAGTGKTHLINNVLSTMNPSENQSMIINMNYYTDANILQKNLESSLQKRTGSTYGPNGSGNLIYFIDDLNLPAIDMYGTQSALELIRQHIDYDHWYDLNKLTVKKIDNCQYIAALNPTAGSFHVNPRLQRHFSTFAVSMPSISSLHLIYLTYLNGHLNSQGFRSNISSVVGNIIKGAFAIHRDMIDTFHKTAINFHYDFHLKHISSIFQGILQSKPNVIVDSEKFVYLWLHETERVYGDCLVDLDDLNKFKVLLHNQTKKLFPQYNCSRFYLSGGGVHADPLIFCHFNVSESSEKTNNNLVSPKSGNEFNSDDVRYSQSYNLNSLRSKLESILSEYNTVHPRMDLVLFDDAIHHLARIVRILYQPKGHVLLIGVGGSGKQSLAKLAAYISEYQLHRIHPSTWNYSLSEFKSDLQSLFYKTGVKNEKVLFLLTENQIINEKILIYVNNLLYEHNLNEFFTVEERDQYSNLIINKAKVDGYPTDSNSLWKYFCMKIRENLKICCCFSPVGSSLRTRVCRFPALLSCTTIDWFLPWNEQALLAIGKKLLNTMNMVSFTSPILKGSSTESSGITSPTASSELMKAIEQLLPQAFISVNKLARHYSFHEKRFVYFTPKSYLDMIQLFQSMYHQRYQESESNIIKLANGIEKLIKAANDVVELEISLKIMLESAEEKKQIAETIALNVQQEKAAVELENENVSIEEHKVESIQSEVQLKQADAAKDLQQAEPALMRAMSALDSLDRRDLGNCRTMSKPPSGVEDVFAAVMVLLAGTNPNIIIQKNGKVREKERTWDAAKKALLGNINGFMDELKGFKVLIDENQVPEVNWKEVRPYLLLNHFNPEEIEKKNSAAAGLCAWVINIVHYYDIVQLVEPKRQALKLANEQLYNANQQLISVRERLIILQSKIQSLTIEYEQADLQRIDAQTQANKGKMKLELARRLLSALGSEKIRWNENIMKLKADKSTLLGNCLFVSIYISYMGGFMKEYRDLYIQDMLVPLFHKYMIPWSILSGSTMIHHRNQSISNKLTNRSNPSSNDSNHGQIYQNNISSVSKTLNPLSYLMNDSILAEYQSQGLPTDVVSTENASIILNSLKYPLIIDPQSQGINWIKKRYGKELIIGQCGQIDLIEKLVYAIQYGKTFLLENLSESIDISLYPFIYKTILVRQNKQCYLQLNNVSNLSEVLIHPKFSLILHTKLSNPKYPPELYAEVNIINFSLSQYGLEEQLLSLVIESERYDLSLQKKDLITQQTMFLMELTTLQSHILEQLSNNSDITENRTLIEELEYSKKLSNDIKIKFDESKILFDKLNDMNNKYRPIAKRGSLLYFICNNLYKINGLYMYSLSSFIQVYSYGLATASSSSKNHISSNNQSMKSIETEKSLNIEELNHRITNRMKEIESNDRYLSENVNLHEQINELQQSILIKVYDYIQIGLFDEDKLIIASLITFHILIEEGIINKTYIHALIHCRSIDDKDTLNNQRNHNDSLKWMSTQTLNRLKALEEDLSIIDTKFENLIDKITLDSDDWEDWYNSNTIETRSMPGEFKEVSIIQHLLLIRILRPDKLSNILIQFIRYYLGEDFHIKSTTFNLQMIYQLYSSCYTPFLFILYPGMDPLEWIESLAAKNRRNVTDASLTSNLNPQSNSKGLSISQFSPKNNTQSPQSKPNQPLSNDVLTQSSSQSPTPTMFMNISMGQGQEKRAIETIKSYSKTGGWVFLQNIHLMQSWLSTLEDLLGSIEPHPNFRLFLSIEPPHLKSFRNLPEGLLLSCLTISNEPAADLKSNLLRSWSQFDSKNIDEYSTATSGLLKACVFGLCFYHSVMLGRRRFGYQGWSRPYSFNQSDLRICGDILESYINGINDNTSEQINEDDYGTYISAIPWKDLRYMFGEIMYGGHITDFFDRRINMTYLTVIFNEKLLKKGELAPKLFSPDSRVLDYGGYRGFIDTSLPSETPSIYGLHTNAEIKYYTNQTEGLFQCLLSFERDMHVDSGSSNALSGSLSQGKDIIHDLLKRIPEPFDLLDIQTRAKDAIKGRDSGPYIVVMIQECSRFNVILENMKLSLEELLKGLNGQLNMSQSMEDMFESLISNTVPGRNPIHLCSWEKLSWPSRKSLNSWFVDLINRHKQLVEWSSSLALPPSVCLPYLINPTALLTAVKQVTARKLKLPLDSMSIETHVTRMTRVSEVVSSGLSHPKDGILIHGMLIEGARWSDEDEMSSNTVIVHGIACCGCLCDSNPRQLLVYMPLIYVQGVEVKSQWKPESVGYLRNDPSVYECPVYATSSRGNSYIFLSTLTTIAPTSKWILAGVALLMQSDD